MHKCERGLTDMGCHKSGFCLNRYKYNSEFDQIVLSYTRISNLITNKLM